MYELATKNTDTVRLSASDLDKKVIELKYDFAKALDGLLKNKDRWISMFSLDVNQMLIHMVKFTEFRRMELKKNIKNQSRVVNGKKSASFP